MSCGCGDTCTCGCCAGTSVATPIGENNAPGLSAIAYRTGTWATFNESMLARLSSSDYPALAGLKTRSNDDFSIALLDASAVVLDILTFYQERLANESYLRTATQLYSLIQLSQLIGYQPSPGVSASVYLAFSLSAAPGLPPNPTNAAISIPSGTTVQSVPAQGQTPQAFQTSAVILAKPDWNALAVQTGIPWTPNSGDTSVYLQGTSTQLNPGDAFLIVGDERGGSLATGSASDPTNNNWDVRIVSTVTPDSSNGRTLITWSEGLGGGGVSPAQVNPRFYALRQRAALFGYNAINPIMLTTDALDALYWAGLLNSNWPPDWYFGYTTNVSLASEAVVDLDNVYSKIVPGGWIALIRPTSDYSRTPAGSVSLFAIRSVSTVSRSDYSLSGKITRVLSDSNAATEGQLSSGYTATRTVSALAQSELLPAAEQPLDYPLYGTVIDLETVRDDLAAIQAVAVTGSNPQLVVNPGVTVTFNPYDASGTVTLGPGSTLTLMQPPPTVFNTDGSIPDWSGLTNPVSLVVADANGRLGTADAALSSFTVEPAPSNAPLVQEVALVTSVSQVSSSQSTAAITPARTRIVLSTALINCYDRTVTTVNANVGAATAGSPVTELLGSGAAATPNQTFTLKQTPLTYTQALTPTGSASSLQVAVNGADWTLVPTLYNQPPQAQVFTTMNLTGGKAQVIFGDGVEGSTLPTGQNNIIATYRVGLGVAGNVGAGSITTLVDRPVGVNGVTNPLPATGGQNAQSVSDIQTNAPMSVQTLGRAVSITDYQNFAATFAGIAEASALWIPSGFYRGVFLTVAAAGGPALPPGNLTLSNLTASLIAYGNPGIAVRVVSFWETLFGLKADLTYDPAYSVDAVNAAVMALLNATYSFANRTFGQGVSGDELAALIQGVTGVVAVNVTSVKVIATSAAGDLGSAGYSVANWQNWIQQQKHLKRPRSGSPSAICPYIPIPKLHRLPDPAEILVISPNPTDVVLGVMS
jgi:hypothetical protein